MEISTIADNIIYKNKAAIPLLVQLKQAPLNAGMLQLPWTAQKASLQTQTGQPEYRRLF